MIAPQGKLFIGLDEFMLRSGHMKILANICCETRGSWYRIDKAMSESLTRLVDIPSDLEEHIAEYLSIKRLSPPNAIKEDQRNQFRYPELIAGMSNDKLWSLSKANDELEEKPAIWWQDYCLAMPEVPSKVGGITVTAQSGSKTGLSHIYDWAKLVGLVTNSAQPTAIGRLLVKLGSDTTDMTWKANPYVLGDEKIFLGYVLLEGDMDVFSRLVPKLLELPPPVKKQAAVHSYVESVCELAEEAETSTEVSSRQRDPIYRQLRELKRAASKGRREMWSTSTAWHRASSRLESYADLGLLAKGDVGSKDRFSYIYYPTPLLQKAGLGLESSATGAQWLNEHLVDVLYDVESSHEPLDAKETCSLLPELCSVLSGPLSSVPITPLALGIVKLRKERGLPVSLGGARQSIIQLAHDEPDVARLERGYSGTDAEFVSLKLRGI